MDALTPSPVLLTLALTPPPPHRAPSPSPHHQVSSLKLGIHSVFGKVGCSSALNLELLGSEGVTEANLMQYLGIIEQRTHEILQLYAASQPQASPGPSSSPSPGPSPSPSPGPSPDPAASSAQRGVLPTAAPPLTPTYDAVPPPYSPRRRCKRATPVPTRAAAREAQGLRVWHTSWAKGRSCRPARTASRSARRARAKATAPSRTRCRHPPSPHTHTPRSRCGTARLRPPAAPFAAEHPHGASTHP